MLVGLVEGGGCFCFTSQAGVEWRPRVKSRPISSGPNVPVRSRDVCGTIALVRNLFRLPCVRPASGAVGMASEGECNRVSWYGCSVPFLLRARVLSAVASAEDGSDLCLIDNERWMAWQASTVI